MTKLTRQLVVLLLLGVIFFSPKVGEPPSRSLHIGGGNYYNVGGNCPDPYSINYSKIVKQWPLKHYKMTQGFKWVHPANDMAASFWEPIYAVGFGIVEKSEYQAGGYGYHVVIDHADDVETLYAHMIQAPEVEVGDFTYPGKLLGYVGSTGKSTGPHLHFEVLLNNCNIDPHTVIEGYSR